VGLEDVSWGLREGLERLEMRIGLRTGVVAHLKGGEVIVKNLGVSIVAGVVPASAAHVGASSAAVLLL